MYEIKIEDVYEDFGSDKEIFDFTYYSTKSKYYDNSNNLVIGTVKDETRDVAIEEFVWLKDKMYSSLVDNNEHKKKGVNRNGIATISHNEYKDVLLNNKGIRHSVNRIQGKDHRIRTYEINKIPWSCFDHKTFI